jgi:hypothetical protein
MLRVVREEGSGYNQDLELIGAGYGGVVTRLHGKQLPGFQSKTRFQPIIAKAGDGAAVAVWPWRRCLGIVDFTQSSNRFSQARGMSKTSALAVYM